MCGDVLRNTVRLPFSHRARCRGRTHRRGLQRARCLTSAGWVPSPARKESRRTWFRRLAEGRVEPGQTRPALPASGTRPAHLAGLTAGAKVRAASAAVAGFRAAGRNVSPSIRAKCFAEPAAGASAVRRWRSVGGSLAPRSQAALGREARRETPRLLSCSCGPWETGPESSGASPGLWRWVPPEVTKPGPCVAAMPRREGTALGPHTNLGMACLAGRYYDLAGERGPPQPAQEV